MKTLRVWITGFASLLALAACQPLQAQTIEPIFFAGVVGETEPMQTVQGNSLTFITEFPTSVSVFNQSFGYNVIATPPVGNVVVLSVTPFAAPIVPTFVSWTLDYVAVDSTPAGSGEAYIIIFNTTDHRDAFVYYLQQQAVAADYASYVYWTSLINYEFWMGQENEGMALYSLYTGLGDYYYLVTVNQNPQFASYYYWYYRGLGAYYYFEGLGDLESANLAFAYHVSLANAALAE